MLDHHHVLATMEDIIAETMEKLELEGVNIFYISVAVCDSIVGVIALLAVARYLIHIHLIRLLLFLLQGVLVLLFGLLRISLRVLNWVLIHRYKYVLDLRVDFLAGITLLYQTQHSTLPYYPFTSRCIACHRQHWHNL